MAKVRQLSSSQQGQPGSSLPKQSWPKLKRPSLRARKVKTYLINDPSDGRTQPEFSTIVGGARTLIPTKSVRQVFQNPQTPPKPNAGEKVIKTPRQGRLIRR